MQPTGNSRFKEMNSLKSTTNLDYGQDWLVKDAMTWKDLGENEIKLRYLQKSLKSKRRLEQRDNENFVDEEVNKKYKFDKNAVVGRKFPYEAQQFKYPNDHKEKPKSLYIKSNDAYGAKKPNDLELPGKFIYFYIILLIEKYFPINNTFTNEFNHIMYENNSLNTVQTRSKVHSNLDSVV
jgi:hypothetical protein